MNERQKSQLGNLLKIWAILGPGLGLAVGWLLAYRQTVVTEKTYDRAAGRIVAKLKTVGLVPTDNDIPAALRTKGDPFPAEVHFDNLDQMYTLNPTIVVENVGDEPVDALRIEIQETDGIIDARGLPPELMKAKTPWVVRQSEIAEYMLNEKLTHGKKATVTIIPGLIGQMSQSQAKDERENRDHLGRFKITVYGRIVGATTFDRADAEMQVRFVWVPRGFSDDKCKTLLNTMRPRVEVIQKD